MKVLLDTNLLVPAVTAAHPMNSVARGFLREARDGQLQAAISQHSLAETYRVLSTLPIEPRITPQQAWQLIQEAILPFVTVVPLTPEDYRAVLERMAGLGIRGGAIHDALIAQAAQKINADRLVTFNVEDFRRVWPEGHDKITRP